LLSSLDAATADVVVVAANVLAAPPTTAATNVTNIKIATIAADRSFVSFIRYESLECQCIFDLSE
jgi:hypothetical protein